MRKVRGADLVLLSVVLGEFTTLVSEVLLHQWVHHDLFAHGVTSDLPAQLVSPAFACTNVSLLKGSLILVMVLVHLLNIVRI